MKNWISKIWNAINGHKTIICLVLLYILKQPEVCTPLGSYCMILTYLLTLATGGAFVGHVQTTTKNKQLAQSVKDNNIIVPSEDNKTNLAEDKSIVAETKPEAKEHYKIMY